jgi:hypothetical protein
MPTAEARAAFNAAQKIAADMRDIHAQEHALTAALEKTDDPPSRTALEDELRLIQTEWSRLFGEYTQAFAKFTAAVHAGRLK